MTQSAWLKFFLWLKRIPKNLSLANGVNILASKVVHKLVWQKRLYLTGFRKWFPKKPKKQCFKRLFPSPPIFLQKKQERQKSCKKRFKWWRIWVGTAKIPDTKATLVTIKGFDTHRRRKRIWSWWGRNWWIGWFIILYVFIIFNLKCQWNRNFIYNIVNIYDF